MLEVGRLLLGVDAHADFEFAAAAVAAGEGDSDLSIRGRAGDEAGQAHEYTDRIGGSKPGKSDACRSILIVSRVAASCRFHIRP